MAGPSDAPVTRDIVFRAGASESLTFGIASGGVAWDMTGWTSAVQVRLTDRYGAPTSAVYLQATCTYNTGTGFWTLAFDATLSALLTPGVALPLGVRYVWDWKLTTPAGVVYVPLAGTVTVLPKVTA